MIPTAFIITLQMDTEAATRFTAMRQAYFPPHRNWLAAHITLFHALPITAADDVLRDVQDLAGETNPFPMQVERVMFLGGGVAYAIASASAMRLRSALATGWTELLGRQDRAWQGPLHVTVQNKVDPTVARALHAELARDFVPHEICATGLEVWHYVGGPWRHVATCAFADPAIRPASQGQGTPLA